MLNYFPSFFSISSFRSKIRACFFNFSVSLTIVINRMYQLFSSLECFETLEILLRFEMEKISEIVLILLLFLFL